MIRLHHYRTFAIPPLNTQSRHHLSFEPLLRYTPKRRVSKRMNLMYDHVSTNPVILQVARLYFQPLFEAPVATLPANALSAIEYYSPQRTAPIKDTPIF